jgi:hypothetical protein
MVNLKKFIILCLWLIKKSLICKLWSKHLRECIRIYRLIKHKKIGLRLSLRSEGKLIWIIINQRKILMEKEVPQVFTNSILFKIFSKLKQKMNNWERNLMRYRVILQRKINNIWKSFTKNATLKQNMTTIVNRHSKR